MAQLIGRLLRPTVGNAITAGCTGLFVAGPVGAVVAGLLAYRWARRRWPA